MDELFPLLVAAGYFLLRAMSSRAKKAKQEQLRTQRAEEPSVPERYDRQHPLPKADTSQETRLERKMPDSDAPESLGSALKRISEALQAEFDPDPIPEPAPLPRQERLPKPPTLPGTGSIPQSRPIPKGRDLSKKAIGRARLESTTSSTQSAEDRFEATGEVFRQVSSRPKKHAHDQRKAPSRINFLRNKKRLRQAIIASEVLSPPKSKRRQR